MYKEEIEYTCEGTKLYGTLYSPSKNEKKRPGILVVHAWRGKDDFTCEKAQMLAELGYVGFAVDLYGKKTPALSNEEAGQLMLPLWMNRALLQERIKAAYSVLCQQPCVDAKRIGAIGFCFGGLTVIELLRSGADVRGIVSFHASLGNARDHVQAKTVPIAPHITGAALIIHGHDDPLVSQADIAAMQSELTMAGVDWQMHIHGHTAHAFTDPQAHAPEAGLMYQKKTCERALKAMRNFFEEVLI